MYPRPPTTMMNRESVPWMLRESATTLLSNRKDLSVPGVLITSGVEARDELEDNGDEYSGTNAAAMTSAIRTVKSKKASVSLGNHLRSCASIYLIKVTALMDLQLTLNQAEPFDWYSHHCRAM